MPKCGVSKKTFVKEKRLKIKKRPRRREKTEEKVVMFKTTLKVDGMMCGMCESHVNDAVRGAFNVKKVTSSHSRGETVIISDDAPDKEALVAAIEKTGYKVLSADTVPYEKKGLFSAFGKK